MNRRKFLARGMGAAIAFMTPRAVRAATAAADPGTLADSSASAAPAITVAVGGDTTLGYNLQDHFDAQLAVGKA
jgi:hypothetical protein